MTRRREGATQAWGSWERGVGTLEGALDEAWGELQGEALGEALDEAYDGAPLQELEPREVEGWRQLVSRRRLVFQHGPRVWLE